MRCALRWHAYRRSTAALAVEPGAHAVWERAFLGAGQATPTAYSDSSARICQTRLGVLNWGIREVNLRGGGRATQPDVCAADASTSRRRQRAQGATLLAPAQEPQLCSQAATKPPGTLAAGHQLQGRAPPPEEGSNRHWANDSGGEGHLRVLDIVKGLALPVVGLAGLQGAGGWGPCHALVCWVAPRTSRSADCRQFCARLGASLEAA